MARPRFTRAEAALDACDYIFEEVLEGKGFLGWLEVDYKLQTISFHVHSYERIVKFT